MTARGMDVWRELDEEVARFGDGGVSLLPPDDLLEHAMRLRKLIRGERVGPARPVTYQNVVEAMEQAAEEEAELADRPRSRQRRERQVRRG